MRNLDLMEVVSGWTERRFLMRSGFYSGRGPNRGDLNSDILEMFYQGIKKEVGPEEASNFVRFVNKLTDLSASAFVVAFEKFAAANGKEAAVVQEHGDSTRLDAYGPALEAQAFATIMSAIGGRQRSEDELRFEHGNIKADFIHRHQDEIPLEERRRPEGLLFE